MRTGRPVAAVSVTAEQRLELERWSRRPKTAQALAMRSRIILLAAQGGSNKSIAQKLATTPHTVGKWRKRFQGAGNDGLLDEPRPGTSRKLSDRQVELVLARTLESQPEAATHWSTRDMAKACGLSQSSDQPHLARLFSGAPSFRRPSSFPAIRCSSRRCATSLACILTRPTAPWCYAWTRRARYRRWIEPRRCYPCVQGRSNAAPTIMRVTAPPACLPRWIPSRVN